MENKEPLQSSKGHEPGLLPEDFQQSDKPKADSPATAGIANRDEDAADPERAAQGGSKGFENDQQGIDAGLDDGDLDNDLSGADPTVIDLSSQADLENPLTRGI